MVRTKLIEKIGYGFGDMSSSTFWKIFSYYLPFFYSNIFGLSLIDAGVLVLVTRIWDAVSDPMMGIIADRTNTKWGKYRPYLLFVAPLFSIAGILLFTTPDWTYSAKLIYAYVTYILMRRQEPWLIPLCVLCPRKDVGSEWRMDRAKCAKTDTSGKAEQPSRRQLLL